MVGPLGVPLFVPHKSFRLVRNEFGHNLGWWRLELSVCFCYKLVSFMGYVSLHTQNILWWMFMLLDCCCYNGSVCVYVYEIIYVYIRNYMIYIRNNVVHSVAFFFLFIISKLWRSYFISVSYKLVTFTEHYDFIVWYNLFYCMI